MDGTIGVLEIEVLTARAMTETERMRKKQSISGFGVAIGEVLS